MDGDPTLLRFPVTTPPAPGETVAIAPGILWLRMPLPFALDHINLWLVKDGPGWTIVDTGYAMPGTRMAWERVFAAHLEGRPVSRLVVTHYHPDHIGLAEWLTARWQAPLWITEKEWLHARMLCRESADFVRLRHDYARRAGLDAAASEAFGDHEAGYRRGVPAVPAAFRRLADGMTFAIGGREWRVVVGEGHAPEHACLYCTADRVLIAGDQVLPRISPNISLQPHEPDGDPLARFLASLSRLRRALPAPTLVLPSHGLPFFGLHQRIDALVAHHAARCAEIRAACRRPQSAADLLPLLFRRPLDRHQQAFALGEALAHLAYLANKGALARRLGGDGVERFALNAV
jgi:glyoxylase-like metal-dependent hydrolase (beta-lactamase superfamily II)